MEVKNQKEKGFTLVELLASLVILSIIIIGIFQVFIFTTKTATSNQTKLVTTHLVKATIERIKVDHESFFPVEKVTSEETIINRNNCNEYESDKVNCDLYEMRVNDHDYEVELRFSQNPDEKELNLINIVVTVTEADKGISSKVEGYVIDEETS